MAAGDSDVKKVGNTFLQVKLVLNKGVQGTEDIFMGKQEILVIIIQEFPYLGPAEKVMCAALFVVL